MKKKRLNNRIVSAVLALVLALAMCVTPAASKNVSAGQNDEITDYISIVPTQTDVTLEEGEAGDMSSYFTVKYDAGDGVELYTLYGNDSQAYYSDKNDNYEPFSKTLTLSYYSVNENGEETALGGVPSDPGTYKAYASFVDSSYYAYDPDGEIIGYFWTEYEGEVYIESGSLEYTIAEAEDTADGVFVKAKENNLTIDYNDFFDEDGNQKIDMADKFKVIVRKDGVESDAEADADLAISYIDSNGNQLSNAPKKPGTYTARAELAAGTTVTCEGEDITLEEPVSGKLSYTLTKTYEAEKLELVYGNEDLPDKDAFILLMFGDGFTADQQQDFYNSAVETADYVMDTSPYDEFTDVIKIYAYGTVSNESGARADKATTQAEADADTRDTYFGSSFWTGGMQRLLSVPTEGIEKINALKEENCPYADYSVVIVNSDTYGGSGGDICVASLNSLSLEMMLHELGHTIADLADEYWAGASYAAELANMTKESDPEKVRWSRFIGKNGVGVYKHDQNETSVDWYRPSDNCKMQYLSPNSPFCEVCKEELRKAFCADSNITKMFFQTYADEFYQSDEGKDMSEYFIIRKGKEETTGDKLGDALTLEYYDADGNLMTELPSQEGTYTIKASFEGNDTFDACELTTTYTIDLPNLITFEGVESKVYDGTPVEPKNIKVDYDGEYTVSAHYVGTIPYATGVDLSYDSDEAPIKPGKYTVTVTAFDANGNAISRKSKDYQISIKTTDLVNNNTGVYPGAQDWYNNKHIVIVGEGFTAEEQDKFEELAQEYVDYILNTEPFKETKLYFNFTTAEAISEESGLGGDSYFKLRCDENGKILPESLSAISTIGYNNVSPYYRGNIIIVNDDSVKEGAFASDASRAYVYGGTDEKSMEYVARELLNYLTGHEEGYVASTEDEIEAQRIELLNALYYTWYGEDYAVVVSRAYDEEFVENGSPIELNDYFHTYILGKEVPKSEIEYTVTYYDSEGNKLDGAPSKAGTYYALGEIIPSSDELYASDYDGKVFWKVRDDETVDENGYVYDADGNEIGYLFTDSVTEVTMDGTNYHIPRARGYVSYTIQSSGASGSGANEANGGSTSGKNSAKTGDTTPLALYLILLAGAAVAGGTAYSKRRRG